MAFEKPELYVYSYGFWEEGAVPHLKWVGWQRTVYACNSKIINFTLL